MYNKSLKGSAHHVLDISRSRINDRSLLLKSKYHRKGNGCTDLSSCKERTHKMGFYLVAKVDRLLNRLSPMRIMVLMQVQMRQRG